MKRLIRSIVVACPFAMAFASPALAQNQLTNPGFTTDLSGWSSNAGTTFDAANDADGSLASGSARWTGTLGPNVTTNGGVSQCVDGITPGTVYEFGGWILLSTLQPGGHGRVVIVFYSGAGCSGLITSASANQVTTAGSWQLSSGSGVAPAGAVSARVLQNETSGPGGGDIVINVDNMFLQEGTGVPVMSLWLIGVLAALTMFAAARHLRVRPVA